MISTTTSAVLWLCERPAITGFGGIATVLSLDHFNRYAAAFIAVLTIITLLPKAGRVVSTWIQWLRRRHPRK